MIHILITIFLFFIFQNTAIAAKEGGNGALAHVCRADNGIKVQLLDLYNAEIKYKRTLENHHGDVATIIEKALEKLKGHTQFVHSIRKELAVIENILDPIPYGHELEMVDDAFPVSKEQGCKFEQLANYTDDGILYYSQELFDKLDNFNIAALYLHEAVYAIRRNFGDETSQKTSKFIAHLMAKDGLPDVLHKLAKESVLFKTGSYVSEDQGCRIHISEENELQFSISAAGNPMKCEANGEMSLTFLGGGIWEISAKHINDSNRRLTYYLKFQNTHVFIISSHPENAKRGYGLIYRKEI